MRIKFNRVVEWRMPQKVNSVKEIKVRFPPETKDFFFQDYVKTEDQNKHRKMVNLFAAYQSENWTRKEVSLFD